MIVDALNLDSRIETLLEGASVLFTINSMLRLSPVFAYKGCVLLVNMERMIESQSYDLDAAITNSCN